MRKLQCTSQLPTTKVFGLEYEPIPMPITNIMEYTFTDQHFVIPEKKKECSFNVSNRMKNRRYKK